MGIKVGDILGTVTDLIPGGGIAKTLLKGALGLVLKKAAAKISPEAEAIVGKVLEEAPKTLEGDKELQKAVLEEESTIRKFFLDTYGLYTDLSTKFEKVIRSLVRPTITWFFTGLLGYLVITKQPVDDKFFWLASLTIAAWYGQKGWERYQSVKNGKRE